MVMLGLLLLSALAEFAGVAGARSFYLPTIHALILGFPLGVVVCTVVGRALGLRGTDGIGTNKAPHQHEVGATAASRRRAARPRHSRGRSTVAAPVACFG